MQMDVLMVNTGLWSSFIYQYTGILWFLIKFLKISFHQLLGKKKKQKKNRGNISTIYFVMPEQFVELL